MYKKHVYVKGDCEGRGGSSSSSVPGFLYRPVKLSGVPESVAS